MESLDDVGGASDRTEVAEAVRGHGHRPLDEAGDHQTVAGVEEQHLGVDPDRSGGPSGDLLDASVDVLAGALTRDAQDDPAAGCIDEVVEVGQPGESPDRCIGGQPRPDQRCRDVRFAHGVHSCPPHPLPMRDEVATATHLSSEGWVRT